MHVHDQITWKKLPRRFGLFPLFNFGDALGREKHVVNQISHLLSLHPFQNVLAHLVFLSGKHMHDVPLIFRCEYLCHKSVQPGKEVHNVHQNKIKQSYVATEQ